MAPDGGMSDPQPDLLLRFKSELSAVDESCAAVLGYLQPFALDARTLHRTEVILEELVSNIVRHSSAKSMSIGATVRDGLVELTVEDDGAPFDPFAAPDPEPFTSLELAELGGRGIVLVKSFSASTRYDRVRGRNRVTISVAGS